MRSNTGLRSITLEPTVEAPYIARRFATETAEGALGGEDLDALRLLVSELVANAVLHAGTWLHVAVEARTPVTRVEVTDSAGMDVPTGFDEPDDIGARLLDGLADRWGVDPRSHGKAVWFELRPAG
jgi:anti-sigma regulatory factor (Ser/Thr protein kinase)